MTIGDTVPASFSSHTILVLRRKLLSASLTFNNPEKEPRSLLKGSGRKLESFCDEGAAPLKKPRAKEELTNGQWRGAVLDAGVLSAGVASGVEEENSGVYWRVPPPLRVTWFFYITSRPYPTHDIPHATPSPPPKHQETLTGHDSLGPMFCICSTDRNCRTTVTIPTLKQNCCRCVTVTVYSLMYRINVFNNPFPISYSNSCNVTVPWSITCT